MAEHRRIYVFLNVIQKLIRDFQVAQSRCTNSALCWAEPFSSVGVELNSVIMQRYVDHRKQFYSVWNQQGLQSCTACSIADAFAWELRKNAQTQARKDFIPSPLFVYFNARRKTGQHHLNTPIEISDCMRAVADYGVCPETYWPNRKSRFNESPCAEAYRVAGEYAGVEFERLDQTHKALTKSLADGRLFFFGLRLYHSNAWDFHDGKIAGNGHMDLSKEIFPHISNHAALAVGYDEKKKVFIIRNSFGEEWGKNGYFTIAFDYALDACRSYDFWQVKLPL